MRAAVLGVGGLVAARVERPLLAVRDDAQPCARDSQAREVVAHGARPLLAERQVVLDGAALVAVPLDDHADAALALQPQRVLLQDGARLVGERRAVVLEAHVCERAALAHVGPAGDVAPGGTLALDRAQVGSFVDPFPARGGRPTGPRVVLLAGSGGGEGRRALASAARREDEDREYDERDRRTARLAERAET